ncbi:unnamed protein product [Chondrus crispus]|uniref:Uncharacterized protein n=1 Tax=Chondrus crispus TaxID=2769 RepID=R7Q675_CHOCR|nr:unnamed protein product [Chondrus crispus]CDF32896.1 unnamed protein product [Chondrus crispus]|eukprot:XP_005712697.1 unnamed protein product [Chondrus crispus]
MGFAGAMRRLDEGGGWGFWDGCFRLLSSLMRPKSARRCGRGRPGQAGRSPASSRGTQRTVCGCNRGRGGSRRGCGGAPP